LNIPTPCRYARTQDTANIPGFLYAVNISISQLANIAILLLLLVRIYREYAGIF